jgi:hypothetical protein
MDLRKLWHKGMYVFNWLRTESSGGFDEYDNYPLGATKAGVICDQ